MSFHDRCAQSRKPMNMIFQDWAVSLFQAVKGRG